MDSSLSCSSCLLLPLHAVETRWAQTGSHTCLFSLDDRGDSWAQLITILLPGLRVLSKRANEERSACLGSQISPGMLLSFEMAGVGSRHLQPNPGDQRGPMTRVRDADHSSHVWSPCYVPDTLSVTSLSSHSSPSIIMPTSLMGLLRHREVKEPVQGHTANNSGHLSPEPASLMSMLVGLKRTQWLLGILEEEVGWGVCCNGEVGK